MYISLRLKLALLSLILLALPLSGMHLSSIVKTSLLESRRQALMFSARAVAQAISGREGLFNQELFHALDSSRDLYLVELTTPMRLNGKFDDWQPHLANAKYFDGSNLLYSAEKGKAPTCGFTHMVGRRGDYIYALFIVDDDHVVYRQPNSLTLERADHLQIALVDDRGHQFRYVVATAKPGWVNAYLMPDDPDLHIPTRNETRIQGVWAKSERGYIIELRIPGDFVGKKLGFGIADVDDAESGQLESVIGTSNTENPGNIGWLLTPSSTINDILKSLNRPQSRIQVVDTNQHVRASFGSLKTPSDGIQEQASSSFGHLVGRLFSPVFHLFTEPFAADFTDLSSQASTLDLKGVSDALLGKSSTSSYTIADKQVEVMVAITPLYEGDTIVGAVVVEQTTNSILALKNRVIRESIGMTLVVLVFGGFALLIFAFRISSRIRQLRNQAAQAIGKDGRILPFEQPAKAHDEIGDLSQTLYSILCQLKAHSEYREKMADNLEHEMRTPMASISASLANLNSELADQPQHIRNYLNWALRDVKRLEAMLTAIRDATSLNNALDQGFMETFNLTEALAMWVQYSWQSAFPQIVFQTSLPAEKMMIHGDPDRIRQMLDKLLENSVAFHTSGTPIILKLRRERQEAVIDVINHGPPIGDEMLEPIFNSMVSLREKNDTEPHLGLGLFIVRTIATHHAGTVQASNLHGEINGVCFSIRLPLGSDAIRIDQ